DDEVEGRARLQAEADEGGGRQAERRVLVLADQEQVAAGLLAEQGGRRSLDGDRLAEPRLPRRAGRGLGQQPRQLRVVRQLGRGGCAAGRGAPRGGGGRGGGGGATAGRGGAGGWGGGADAGGILGAGGKTSGNSPTLGGRGGKGGGWFSSPLPPRGEGGWGGG